VGKKNIGHVAILNKMLNKDEERIQNKQNVKQGPEKEYEMLNKREKRT
jgi:hypothetical protein